MNLNDFLDTGKTLGGSPLVIFDTGDFYDGQPKRKVRKIYVIEILECEDCNDENYLNI